MKKNKINIGIIGAGNMASKYLKVLYDQKNYKIISIYSRTYSKAKILANVFRINNIYSNLDFMLKDKHLDAIIVAVSYENIFKVSKKVLLKKIPILLEKPAGLSLIEIKTLEKLAKKNNVKNMVGLNRRFYSNFIKAKKIINKYGGIENIIIEGHERFWNIKNNKKYSNLNKWLFINSIHTIDLIRYFGGEIDKINILKQNKKLKHGDQFLALIKYKNKNIIGSYFSNWFTPAGWSVKLYSDEISIIFDPLEKTTYMRKNMKKYIIKPDIVDEKYKPGLFNQMKSFANYLNNNQSEGIPTLNDVSKTYKIINKFYL